MDLASLLAVAAPAVRMILSSHALLEPARQLAKTLDQGFGSLERGKLGLDVSQPGIVRLGIVLAERRFRVLKFPS